MPFLSRSRIQFFSVSRAGWPCTPGSHCPLVESQSWFPHHLPWPPCSHQSCPRPGRMLRPADFCVTEAPVVPCGWLCVHLPTQLGSPASCPNPHGASLPASPSDWSRSKIPKPPLPTLGKPWAGRDEVGGQGSSCDAAGFSNKVTRYLIPFPWSPVFVCVVSAGPPNPGAHQPRPVGEGAWWLQEQAPV